MLYKILVVFIYSFIALVGIVSIIIHDYSFLFLIPVLLLWALASRDVIECM